MRDRRTLRAIVAACAAGILSACGQAGPAPLSALPGAAAAVAHLRSHWAQTSIGTFPDPYGVAVNPFCAERCDVYVADPGAKRVWKVAPDGNRTAIGDWIDAPAFDPIGVAIDRDHNVYVADKEPGGVSRVWRVAPNGTTTRVDLRNVGGERYFRGVAVTYPQTHPRPYMHAWIIAAQASYRPETDPGYLVCSCANKITRFVNPYAVAGGATRAEAYVADAGTKTVYATSPLGGDTRVLRGFDDPHGVAVSLDERHVYVADAGGKRVWKSDPDGTWSVIGVFAEPSGVAVDAAGTVFVADPGSKHVWKLTP